VLFLNALINIPDDTTVHRLLAELSRVCKPGGRIFVDIRNGSNPWLRFRYWIHNLVGNFVTRGYVLASTARLLEQVGCRVVDTHPIGVRWLTGPAAFLLEAERLEASPLEGRPG